MTAELRQQRNSLIAANALNDERRAFIEAALSGVPAGVVGVDEHGVVTVSNAAAERLLCGAIRAALVGRRIERGLARARRRSSPRRARSRSRLHQAQATLMSDGRERLLNVRVTGDPSAPTRAA